MGGGSTDQRSHNEGVNGVQKSEDGIGVGTRATVLTGQQHTNATDKAG